MRTYRKTVSLMTADPDRRFIEHPLSSNGTGTGLSLSKFFSALLKGTGMRNTPRRLVVNLPNIGSLHLELSRGRYTGFQGEAPSNPPSWILEAAEPTSNLNRNDERYRKYNIEYCCWSLQ